jgi:UDP-GlcNAc:undecaprenyl-phosphate GlcNAc-1-phosphate transferase
MLKYLIPFLTSFLLSVFFICLSFLFGKKNISEKRDSERHIHTRGRIIRWGGLAIVLSFNVSILLNKDLYLSFGLWGIMAASLLILIIGIWDDICELSWKVQLIFQSLMAGMVFLFGIRIQYLVDPFSGKMVQLDSGWMIGISFLAGLVWILLLMNAMNWLDGIDGLSGGVTLIAVLTIFFLSLKAEVNQPPIAIIAMILVGSILGFLIFNFNPGKIMAGTAGSMFMGFSLAALAIFSGTKIATTLLVLVVPLVDFLWVIGERWKKGKSIFIADKNHLHYKL